MSLVEFQRHLAQLIVSPRVSDQAREAWRTSTELDTRERRRLEAIAADRGLETARTIHRFFRTNALTDGLPLSLQAFTPGQIKPLVAAFWRTRPMVSVYADNESAAFAAFVLAQIEAGTVDNPVLADLLRYELAEHELSLGLGPKADESTTELGDPQRQAPSLAPNRRIVTMVHDPHVLLTRARRREPLTEVPTSGGRILLRSTQVGKVEAAPLIPMLGDVLVACSGRETVAALGEELGYPASEFEALATAGYLVFVPVVF